MQMDDHFTLLVLMIRMQNTNTQHFL